MEDYKQYVVKNTGSLSNTRIRKAMDVLLEEYQQYDEERVRWDQERMVLQEKIGELAQKLEDAETSRDLLLKKYKFLEYSVQQMREHGYGVVPSQRMPRDARIDNKQYSAATLPPSWDNKKILELTQISPYRVILQKYLTDHGFFHEELKSNEEPDWKRRSQSDDNMATERPSGGYPPRPSQQPSARSSRGAHDMSPPGAERLSKTLAVPTRISVPTVEDGGRAATSTPSPFMSPALKQQNSGGGGRISMEKDLSPHDVGDVGDGRDSGRSSTSAGRMSGLAQFNDAVAGSGRELSLQSVAIGKNHMDCVRSIDFHGSMPYLYSASDDGTIKVWNVTQLRRGRIEPLVTFRGHEGIITRVRHVGQDGNLFATCGSDANVMLWSCDEQVNSGMNGPFSFDRISQGCVYSFTGEHVDVVWDIAPHETEPLIASVSSDSHLYVFNRSTFSASMSYQIISESCMPSCVAWSDLNLVVGLTSGSLEVVDTARGTLVATIEDKESNESPVMGSNYANSLYEIICVDNMVYTASANNQIHCYDLRTGESVSSTRAHTDAVTSIALVDDTVISVSHDCRVRLWKTNPFRCYYNLDPPHTHRSKCEEGILSVTVDSSHKYAATGGADGIIRLFEI